MRNDFSREEVVPAALKKGIMHLHLKKLSLSLAVLSNFCLVSNHFFLGKILEKEREYSLKKSYPFQSGCKTWF